MDAYRLVYGFGFRIGDEGLGLRYLRFGARSLEFEGLRRVLYCGVQRQVQHLGIFRASAFGFQGV